MPRPGFAYVLGEGGSFVCLLAWFFFVLFLIWLGFF